MKGAGLLSLLLLLLAVPDPRPEPQPRPDPQPRPEPSLRQKPVVLTHVTVIDGTGAPPRSDQTVLLIGERIAAIGRTGSVPISAGAIERDGTGRFLIPPE